MSDKPSSLRNLGPATDRIYENAGITTVQQIHDLGADETYFRLLKSGSRPHFIAYYALVMGLQGRPWQDCRGAEKDQLRMKFDALKARLSRTDKSRTQMDAALDMLGVVKSND